MDAFSPNHSGYMIMRALEEHGVGVAKVMSPYVATGRNKLREFQDDDQLQYTAPLEEEALRHWLKDQIPFRIEAVICESDSGLDYAERLAEAIHKITPIQQYNGYLEARRDKFALNEVCRKHGIDTVQQALCASIEEAIQDSKLLGISSKTPVIIKPRRGVASDRVSLCRSVDDVPAAFSSIAGSFVFGSHADRHDSVLVQEFVDGAEYAIDMVSKNGAHKVASLWVYDKTSTSDDTNTGTPFAYLSGRLVDPENDPNAQRIFDYIETCLDAVKIKWGMTHSEIKINSKGEIRLIEINCRQQNDHFGPITDACLGYNAMDMCLSAYLDNGEGGKVGDDSLFELVPKVPTLYRHGIIVNLACFVEGCITKVQHLNEMETLESFVAAELFPGFEPGDVVTKTKDIRSDCGWIHLINDDEQQLLADYKKICEWMKTMFQVEPIEDAAKNLETAVF